MIGVVVLLIGVMVGGAVFYIYGVGFDAMESAVGGPGPGGDGERVRESFEKGMWRAMGGVIGIVVGAMVLGGVLIWFLGQWVARSLGGIVEEAKMIRNMQLDVDRSDGSPFSELREVERAFDDMKIGLNALKKYVPSDLIRWMLDWHVEPKLGGEVRELTIFFSDIKDFTPTCESMSPDRVAHVLGDYLSAVCRPIAERKGTVDKYIGDCVMAFWNAPENVDRHAEEACTAAMEIQRAVDLLHETKPEMPRLDTRIGVHTARVMVGNFGSNERFNYSILGDGVNLASRLEGLNKLFGTRVIVSEHTHRLVKSSFEMRRLGLVKILGKAEPVTVYELMGGSGTLDSHRLRMARMYERGLDQFVAGRFDAAEEFFGNVLAEDPEDRPAQRMKTECEYYLEHRPAEGWQGEIRMVYK